MQDIMVSIFMPVYNHEQYVVRALDSIFMQKTRYSYEVLVGEDVSTDNTRRVLREYEAAHPGKLTVFYREQNMHKMERTNYEDLRDRCRGKYIIALEGDDFWLDENKLEKQVDFLEMHPEYLAVAHNCVVVGEDSLPNGEDYPECKDAEYTLEHYMNNIMPGQLTTLMARNYVNGEVFDCWLTSKNTMPADRRLYFALVTNGRVYCMQKKMSAYRHITSGGSSYSANVRYDCRKDEKYNMALMEYAHRINSAGGVLCAEYIYACNALVGWREGQISAKETFSYLKNITNKTKVFFMLCSAVLKKIFRTEGMVRLKYKKDAKK